MKPRSFRLITVLASVLALLLSSAALAGYACPGAEKAHEVARMVEAAMPCAEEMSRAMDDAQPGLCHAHCQADQQTADSFHPPTFAHLTQLGVVLVVDVGGARQVGPRTSPAPALHRETGPPLAIRHCCFRI